MAVEKKKEADQDLQPAAGHLIGSFSSFGYGYPAGMYGAGFYGAGLYTAGLGYGAVGLPGLGYGVGGFGVGGLHGQHFGGAGLGYGFF